MIPSEDIVRRFSHHAPDKGKVVRHEHIRETFKELAHHLNLELPDGREKSLVMTHLEEALMWSNAAIAREGQ